MIHGGDRKSARRNFAQTRGLEPSLPCISTGSRTFQEFRCGAAEGAARVPEAPVGRCGLPEGSRVRRHYSLVIAMVFFWSP